MEQQSTGEYLLYLMACALNEWKPEEKTEGINWEQLRKLAAYSNVESIAWPAVKLMKNCIPQESYKK